MECDWDEMVDSIVYKLQHQLPRTASEVDTIRHLANVPNLCDLFRSWLQRLPNVRASGENKSNQFRTRGNDMFKASTPEYHVVVEAYSKAIFAAPGGSRALALGHANRAAALIRLHRYREAFDDCQLALDGDYPADSRLKVLFRQAECAERLGEPVKLGPIVEDIARVAAEKALQKAEQRRLEAWRAMYDAADRDCTVEEDENTTTLLPCEEAVLKEQEAPAVGRYVVAAEAIKANDTVARETAVSFVPVYDPESSSTLPSFDCQKCAKVNVVPFPCPTCGRACYCSTRCRVAHRPVHRFECFGYRKHLWYQIGIAHLGLRCFLDGFGTIAGEMAKATDASVCYQRVLEATREEDNPFSHYGRVLRLVTNFDKMDPDDRMRYTLAGLMLTIYLQECTPFAEAVKDCAMPPAELLVCCGAFITRHIGQLVCNGHAISELRLALPSKGQFYNLNDSLLLAGTLHLCLKSSRVFTAIFPRISMFNHSCDPNIRNHFERATLTVHATRPIGAGGEVFNCYGPHYRLMAAAERKMLLRAQYCFDCGCERCREGDATFEQRFNMIRCPACRREYAKELNLEELPTVCVYCSAEIPSEWLSQILDLDPDDRRDETRNFQRAESAYNYGKQILIHSNQTRAIALRHILECFTRIATCKGLAHSNALNQLALEYALLMRERFGHMSLEFLTGCFYLLDVWAMFCYYGDDEPEQQAEERTVLKQFRQALAMIGADNRGQILDYMQRYKIIDGESMAECIETMEQTA
uniref:Protein-lysine N-methyltransferase SMYD4 n=1 Tax=Anopheles coluzzii TaxID=1518534 RepID=A0A6E8VWN5_ANOCL